MIWSLTAIRKSVPFPTFSDFILTAWLDCKEETQGTLIPSWNRVLYSIPDIYSKLLEGVEKDNA